MKRYLGVLAATFMLAACGGGPGPIQQAYDDCLEVSSETENDHERVSLIRDYRQYITVGDEGRTLIIETVGEEESGASFLATLCLFDALEMSDAVRNDVNHTRALDGRQTGSWVGFEATWGYHPNSGLNMVITEAGS